MDDRDNPCGGRLDIGARFATHQRRAGSNFYIVGASDRLELDRKGGGIESRAGYREHHERRDRITYSCGSQ